MKKEHFDRYFAERFALESAGTEGDEILSGRMTARSARATVVPIVRGIPRFVSASGYTENFGLQWNRFRSTQLDSASGLPLSANRFWSNTRWPRDALRGKTVLEVGSGAGRFTEILLLAGASVVSFDFSTAVDANRENNAGKGDLLLYQGDLYDIPFPDRYFDYVFCYGVLQHTPDPVKAYRAIFAKLRAGGRIAIDYYLKVRGLSPWSAPKYLWRPLTSRMRPETLLRIVKFYIPLYLPLDTRIRMIPRIGSLLVALIPIPCWNYLGIGLTREQRRDWAILDTFDALGAAYDQPKTLQEVREMVASPENAETEVCHGGNGVVANVSRR